MMKYNADLLPLMYNRFIKVSHSSNDYIDVGDDSSIDKNILILSPKIVTSSIVDSIFVDSIFVDNFDVSNSFPLQPITSNPILSCCQFLNALNPCFQIIFMVFVQKSNAPWAGRA